MLTIRLTRKGKKNQPFFRVVLVDKRSSSKSGKSVEDLGYVDPLTKRKNFNTERIKYWLSKGVKPSETIHNWLVSEKIIEGKKIHVSKLSKKKQAEIDKVKADVEAAAKAKAEAAASQSEASLAPEGAGSKIEETSAPAEPVAEETKPETPEQPA